MASRKDFTRDTISSVARVAAKLVAHIEGRQRESVPKNLAARNPYAVGELPVNEFFRLVSDDELEALGLKRKPVPVPNRINSWVAVNTLVRTVNQALAASKEFKPAAIQRLSRSVERIRVVPHFQGWNDAEVRRSHGERLLDAAERDVRQIRGRWVEKGLTAYYLRRFRRRFTPIEAAAHLLHYETGLVGYSEYLQLMAYNNHFRLKPLLLKHWTPEIGPINYARHMGISSNSVSDAFRQLSRDIDAAFSKVELHQLTFVKAAESLNIGAKGLQQLYALWLESRNEGGLKWWTFVRKSKRLPALRTEMLTLPELSRELSLAVNNLKGTRGERVSDHKYVLEDGTQAKVVKELVDSLDGICSAKSFEKANRLLIKAGTAAMRITTSYAVQYRKGRNTLVTRPVNRTLVPAALALAIRVVSELNARSVKYPAAQQATERA